MIEKFLSTLVWHPGAFEQQKIADCLSSIDELITAQTQKLDTLKTHKKALMQQLFPADGNNHPAPSGHPCRGGESRRGSVRKNSLSPEGWQVKPDGVVTVIGLPANLFFSTGIPVCILVLKKGKKPDDVLFITATNKHNQFLKELWLAPLPIGRQ